MMEYLKLLNYPILKKRKYKDLKYNVKKINNENSKEYK